MDLVDIKDFPKYSFDKNSNQVYGHFYKKFLIPHLAKGYYKIALYNNNKQRKHLLLHRLIFQAYNPDIDISNLCIDHIDNNKLNNNIENLRTATKSQNGMNQKIHKNNKLGYKNINFRLNKYYTVDIRKNKKKYTKSFKTLDEAIVWRDIKLKELHEEYANLG